MQTCYIRFCQSYNDPVWGQEPQPLARTSLVRVTRNRLRRAHFEWVGNPRAEFDLAHVRKTYPMVVRELDPAR